MTIPIRTIFRPAAAGRPVAPSGLGPVTGVALERVLARAPQAEWGLAHQGAGILMSRDRSQGWLVARAGRTLVALGRPQGWPDLDGLLAAAHGRAVLYKCDARTALAARRSGWRVVPVGREAWLDVDRWTASAPACRQLRRKLRAAIAGGVRVAWEDAPDLAALADVAAGWESRHGGERGFSMGRFDAGLIARQVVVTARVAGRVVAFASFFRGRDEWSLDLMRQDGADVPDGTMHAIVAHAASLARDAGARRLSLAAIPDPVGALRAFAGLPRRPPRGGLGQFKRSFGPACRPLYAAGPGWPALIVGLMRVARAIHRPPPLPDPAATPRKGFETRADSCDARGFPALHPVPDRPR